MTSRLVEAGPETQVPGGAPLFAVFFARYPRLRHRQPRSLTRSSSACYLLCDVNGAAQMLHDAGVALPREFAVLGIGRDPRRHTRHSAPQERVTWGVTGSL